MTSLEQIIKDRISVSGPVTFRDFMEMALYHPALGYYCQGKDRVGAEGDFYTSPATHPVFGALMAVQLEQMWQYLGSPLSFTVIEAGAGKGLLARDILDYAPQLSPGFAASLRYLTVEKQDNRTVIARSPDQIGTTKQSPAPPPGDCFAAFAMTSKDPSTSLRVTFPEQSPTLLRSTVQDGNHGSPRKVGVPPGLFPEQPYAPITGCILSNELLDAFPVHRVLLQRGRLKEIFVALKDGRFCDLPGEPSSPRLGQYLKDEGIALAEGQTAEINLEAPAWIGEAAGSLQRGFIVTVDYGELAEELYSSHRRQGTMLTYRRHVVGIDPYQDVGQTDLTSHVDFTAAIAAGQNAGLTTLGLLSQGEFLQNLGFEPLLQSLRSRRLPYDAYLENRFAMMELVRSEGFGDFKVLVQEKGIGPATLYGLTPENELARKLRERQPGLDVPLLQESHIRLLRAKYPDSFMPPDADL